METVTRRYGEVERRRDGDGDPERRRGGESERLEDGEVERRKNGVNQFHFYRFPSIIPNQSVRWNADN